MNIAENYSLQLGQAINRIHINEKFFPLPFSDYIVIQPFSKPSKNYDNWIEVLSLIFPILEQKGIKIVQCGGKDEKSLPYCYNAQGQTNWGQLQYLIRNAKLVLSTDSVSSHLAGHYNVPLVVLISNNFKECIAPYFGEEGKQIILEPDRTVKNPSFMLDEGPNKQINEIKAEVIAKSVLNLLGLEFNYPFDTQFVGNLYNNRQIESCCDNLVDVKKIGLGNLIIRMDINFNENILYGQLQINPCIIISDKEINEDIIKNLRHNISQFIYKITPNHSVKFIKLLKFYKVPYLLVTELPEEELNPIKLDYLDYGIINRINIFTPDKLKMDDIKNNKIYYKSGKFLLGNGRIYQSLMSYKNGISIPNLEPVLELVTEKNIDLLWKETDYLSFLKKTD